MSRRGDFLYRTLVVVTGLLVAAALITRLTVGSPSSGRVLAPPRALATPRAHTPAPAALIPPDLIRVGPIGTSVDLPGAFSSSTLLAPTALDIPAIGVKTSVVPLGQNPDGSAAVPSGTTFTGWYDLGPKPGQIGPAVIIGHVDSYTGPGVFFNLKSLLPGDIITVSDGSVPFSFRVQQVVTYAKDEFPTATVFGPTPDAELRLITCGGPFDRSIGHYDDNVVVYAGLV